MEFEEDGGKTGFTSSLMKQYSNASLVCCTHYAVAQNIDTQ